METLTDTLRSIWTFMAIVLFVTLLGFIFFAGS